MVFTHKKWVKFCRMLSEDGMKSVSAKSIFDQDCKDRYIVLKHDVETKVKNAYRLASIESQFGHCGSYYVQAYLMKDKKNIEMLQKMQDMGHEISYHYDVMDASKGDIERALAIFENDKQIFEGNSFELKTVCQHGNPVADRVGYSSNRDFFRNEKVQRIYNNLSDIMVDFKDKAETDYLYFSDAGRKFKLIFDPINNDLINSDDKNIPFENLENLYGYIVNSGKPCIISIHPHRWTKSAFFSVLKIAVFRIVKYSARMMMKVPVFKNIMNRYYYLAKRI